MLSSALPSGPPLIADHLPIEMFWRRCCLPRPDRRGRRRRPAPGGAEAEGPVREFGLPGDSLSGTGPRMTVLPVIASIAV